MSKRGTHRARGGQGHTVNDRVAVARSLRAVAAKASAAMLARRPRWTEPARIDAATWRAMLEAQEAVAKEEGRLGQQGDM